MAAALGETVLDELHQTGEILHPEKIAAGVLEPSENEACAAALMRVTVRGIREFVSF